jgi:hypothetical protein
MDRFDARAVLSAVNTELHGLMSEALPVLQVPPPAAPSDLLVLASVVAARPYIQKPAVRIGARAEGVATLCSAMPIRRKKLHGKGCESGNWKFPERLWSMVDSGLFGARGEVLYVNYRKLREAGAQGLLPIRADGVRVSLYTHGFVRSPADDREGPVGFVAFRHSEGLFSEHNRALLDTAKRTDTEKSREAHARLGVRRFSARMMLAKAIRQFGKDATVARLTGPEGLDRDWLRLYMGNDTQASIKWWRVSALRAALATMLSE